MIPKIKEFTVGTNLTNALKAAISAVIPVLFFSFFDNMEAGLIMALGAIFTFPSDTPSNLKHKINGLLVTVLIISGANLLIDPVFH